MPKNKEDFGRCNRWKLWAVLLNLTDVATSTRTRFKVSKSLDHGLQEWTGCYDSDARRLSSPKWHIYPKILISPSLEPGHGA